MGKHCSQHNRGVRKRFRCTGAFFNHSAVIHLVWPWKINLLHVNNILLFQNQTQTLLKVRVVRIEKTRRIHEKLQITPVALFSGLYKIHVVMYSKLNEVCKKVNQVETWKCVKKFLWLFCINTNFICKKFIQNLHILLRQYLGICGMVSITKKVKTMWFHTCTGGNACSELTPEVKVSRNGPERRSGKRIIAGTAFRLEF